MPDIMPSRYSVSSPNSSKVRRYGQTNSPYSMPGIVENFETREKAALAANKARESEIRNIYTSILGQDYNAAREAGMSEIARGERQAVGQGTQQMISSGLYGTTTAATIPMQAGKVATEQRLKLEDVLQQRKTENQKDMANFIERIEQPYPDYGMLMQAMAAMSSASPTYSRTINSYPGFRTL